MKTGKRRTQADRKKRKMNEAAAPPVIDDEHDKLMKVENSFLPGIPNDVTLQHICTKLPWRTLTSLKSVSISWRKAIQDRLIQDVRARKHSTQTFLVLSQDHWDAGKASVIAIYSLRDQIFHHLPPIPGLDNGMPWRCQCIAMGEKIYILGGTKDADSGSGPTDQRNAINYVGSQDVYMYDLATQRQWKKCAQMKAGRLQFGCGAVNGKIYVFGGTSLCQPLHGSEVYDPVTDAWSAIKSKNDFQFNHEVTTVGEELYVYCGELMPDRTNAHKLTYGLKAYNPLSNKWRILSDDLRVAGTGPMRFNRFFMAQGKVYSMSPHDLHMYDIDNKSRKGSRTKIHSFSFAAIEQPCWMKGLSQFSIRRINEVLLVEDELMAIVSFVSRIGLGHYMEIPILVKSTGFKGESRTISWKEVACPPHFGCWLPSSFKGIVHL